MKISHIINDLYNFNFTTNTFADKKHENAIKNIFISNGLTQIEKHDKRFSILTNKTNLLSKISELENDFIFIEQPFGSQKTPDFIICVAGFILWIECKSGKKLVWNTGYPKKDVLVVFSSKKTDKTTLFFGQLTELYNKSSNFEELYEKLDKKLKKICKDEFAELFETENFSLYHRRMLTDNTKYENSKIREDFFTRTKILLEL